MKDFELSQGKIGNGLKGAIVAALLYAVLPFFILTFLNSVMGGSLDPNQRMLREALLQLRGTVLLFSLPIVVLGFFASYYLKGTRSKLLFGVMSAFAILAYAFALFLGPDLGNALTALEVELDLDLLFIMTVVGVALLCLRHAGTYLRSRSGWLMSIGVETQAKKVEARSGMAEFGPRHGNFCQANAHAKNTAIWFALIPSLLLTLMQFLASAAGFGAEAAQAAFLSTLGDMAWIAALLSLPLIALAWFRGFYPRGTVSRLLFGGGFALMLVLYLNALLLGSDLQAGLADLGVTLNLGDIFLMLLLLVAFLGLKYVAELKDERRSWKRSAGIKVDERSVDPESRWADLDPHYGKFERGFKESQRALMLFIVIPVILITVLIAFLATMSDPTISSFVAVLQMLSGIALLYGIPVVALGFAKGFYPKGCGGRLLFALLMVPFIAVYAFALLLQGELQATIAAAGLPLDLNAIWGLLLLVIVFRGIMDLAELADNRRSWKISIGRQVKQLVPDERHGPLLDFHPRYGRYMTGTKEARAALRKYIVTPAIIIIILIAVVQVLIDTFSFTQLSIILDDLRSVSSVLLLFAMPVLALTFLRGFYPKGSVSRLSFAWTLCALLAWWLWSITLGGKFATDMQFQEATLGVQLDLSGVILIFMVLELLWGLYYVAEFISYRRDWINNRYQPLDESVKRPKPQGPSIKA